MRRDPENISRRTLRRAAVGLALAAVLVCTLGPGCDNAASATFRETATGAIGDGVKTIMDGVLDGIIAAIEDAGDGGDNSTDNGTGT